MVKCTKEEWSLRAVWLIAARAYPGFCSMKRLVILVFLIPRQDASWLQFTPLQVVRFPQQITGTHLYSWVERGNVRVKCLHQEHNTVSPNQGLNLDHSIQGQLYQPWDPCTSTVFKETSVILFVMWKYLSYWLNVCFHEAMALHTCTRAKKRFFHFFHTVFPWT